MPHAAPDSPTPTDRRTLGLAAALLGLVVAFYLWLPGATGNSWLTTAGDNSYHQLTDAFLAGQLHLPKAPAPELIALADPYDPAANAPYRQDNLSYFDGHYYLYLGPAPALLLAPVRWLSGYHLALAPAAAIFCTIGFAASLALLFLFRSRLDPRPGPGLSLTLGLGMAVGNGYPFLLRSDSPNLLPITAAYAFTMLALLGLALACSSRPLGPLWRVVAGLALALAVASRPQFVFLAPALLLAPGLALRQGRRAAITALLGVGLPFALGLGLLLAYNTARFGTPGEFGARYMLGAWDQRELPSLGFRAIAANFHHYFFGAADHSRYFPFVSPRTWTATGFVWYVPLLWLGLTLFACRPRRASAASDFLPWLVLGIGLINLGALLLLPSGNEAAIATSANARYVMDFLPYLALASALAVLHASARAVSFPGRQRALRVLVLGGTASTALIALSLDLSRWNANSYRRLAEFLNLPTHVMEHLAGVAYGPLRLTLALPTDRIGHTEVIASAGPAESASVFYVTYLDPQSARFGIFSPGLGGPESEIVPLPPGHHPTLELSWGVLYPPLGAPRLTRFTDDQVGWLHRRAVVRVDGRTVLDTVVRADPVPPHTISLGPDAFAGGPAPTPFSGRVRETSRLPVDHNLPAAAAALPLYGAIKLTVRFPSGREGHAEPLVVSGVPQAGNFIYVRYLGPGKIQLGFDHWGQPGVLSPPLTINPAAAHRLVVDHSALYPPEFDPWWTKTTSHGRPATVTVTLNDTPVLTATTPPYPSSAQDVAIGVNPIGGSTCGYVFSGEITEAVRLPPALNP